MFVIEAELLVDRLARTDTEVAMSLIDRLISRIEVEVRLRTSDCTAAEETPFSESWAIVAEIFRSSESEE